MRWYVQVLFRLSTSLTEDYGRGVREAPSGQNFGDSPRIDTKVVREDALRLSVAATKAQLVVKSQSNRE
jgi:hypothetical protein